MLPLSDAQARILDAWKRPSEVHERVSMVPENLLDLAQDAITDCSIVASMCAAVSREERGYSKVTMFPLNPITHSLLCSLISCTDCVEYYIPTGAGR